MSVILPNTASFYSDKAHCKFACSEKARPPPEASLMVPDLTISVLVSSYNHLFFSLSTRVSAFISLALVVVLVVQNNKNSHIKIDSNYFRSTAYFKWYQIISEF